MGDAKRLFAIVLSLLMLTGLSFGRTKQVKKQSKGAAKQVSSKSAKASTKSAKSTSSQASSKSSKSASSKVCAVSSKRKGKTVASSCSSKSRTAPVARGQQGITSERTLEIQNALIREHYLDGEASGVWDQRTKDALVKYQLANGWQTKIIPDSRALIKLGLGPSKDGLLNPESAAVSNAHELGVASEIPGGAAAH